MATSSSFPDEGPWEAGGSDVPPELIPLLYTSLLSARHTQFMDNFRLITQIKQKKWSVAECGKEMKCTRVKCVLLDFNP